MSIGICTLKKHLQKMIDFLDEAHKMWNLLNLSFTAPFKRDNVSENCLLLIETNLRAC